MSGRVVHTFLMVLNKNSEQFMWCTFCCPWNLQTCGRLMTSGVILANPLEERSKTRKGAKTPTKISSSVKKEQSRGPGAKDFVLELPLIYSIHFECYHWHCIINNYWLLTVNVNLASERDGRRLRSGDGVLDLSLPRNRTCRLWWRWADE